MINLIKNELKKTSKFKLLFSYVLVICSIYLIVYVNRNNTRDILNTIFKVIPFLGILICIMFGNIVSNEFQTGTIRVYLTKPYKRWKVIISKIITIYLYIVLLIIIVLLSYYIFINIYEKTNLNMEYIKEVILNFTPIFFLGAVALFLSTITNSTALTVGLSIVICLTSSIIAQILFGFDYTIVEYTFLPYIDFSIFKDIEYIELMQNEFNVYLNIKSGVFILLSNIVLFVILSIITFTKKDIKN